MRTSVLAMCVLAMSSAGTLPAAAQSGGELVPRGGGAPEPSALELCERAGCIPDERRPGERYIVPAGSAAGTPTLADGGTGIRWYYMSDAFPLSALTTGRGIVPRHQMVTATDTNPATLYDFEFHPPLGSNSMQFNLQVQSAFTASIAASTSATCTSSLTPSGRTMAIFLRARLQRVDTAVPGPWETLRQGDVGQIGTLLPYTAFPTRSYTGFVPILSAFDPVTGSYPRYRLQVQSWPVPANVGDASNPFSFTCFQTANPNQANLGLAITSTQMLLTF